ncbi:hypothetical protein [Variovorax sp. HJSM1_2]|uniref:hypothetical protein n=1 Tax=Variovorax sp. HJSM1_2 TaxID=3366263 RepID=UPI003BE5E8E6
MSKVMTLDKLAAQMALGYGTGRHDLYKPWIRIRRKLSSPVSNIKVLRVPRYTRGLHLLSGLETATANVLAWLGCGEIREQFPLWPYPHFHPLNGTNREIDRQRRLGRGMLSICREADIDHGVYPGSKIPFVATIDFAVTLGEWHSERLVLLSCKPYELLQSAPNRHRMQERIQMERLYAQAVEAVHVLVDGRLFSEVLISQLDWIRPLKEEFDSQIQNSVLQKYAEALMRVASDLSLSDAKTYAANQVAIRDHEFQEAYFRASAWLGLIDIDLSREIRFGRPLERDQTHFKKRMQQQLLGGNL